MLLFSLLLIVGCAGDTKKPKSPKKEIKSATIDLTLSGEELFAKHCKLCHGIKGNLELNGAKDLKESVMTLDERIVIITNGKNAMTPFKKLLSEEEIKKVAIYSQSFAKKK